MLRQSAWSAFLKMSNSKTQWANHIIRITMSFYMEDSRDQNFYQTFIKHMEGGSIWFP